MFCVLIYDIEIKNEKDNGRLLKVHEICRKYLNHVEFSVFYGEITKSNLKKLINELNNVIEKDRDSIIIYLFKSREDIDSIVKLNIEEEKRVL
ncbi:MAG: CRISPR-associated endonuclease Cas2 [Nanopusillaceae archaeon]